MDMKKRKKVWTSRKVRAYIRMCSYGNITVHMGGKEDGGRLELACVGCTQRASKRAPRPHVTVRAGSGDTDGSPLLLAAARRRAVAVPSMPVAGRRRL